MASANTPAINEETSLEHEERRLRLDIERAALEERRFSLEQRRKAANTLQQAPVVPVVAPVVVAQPSTPPSSPSYDAPKILTAAQLKEAAKANAAKKAPVAISTYLRRLIPQDMLAATIHNEETRNAACNDANALRAHEVVHAMQHDTMRKRKEEVLRDTGVQGKGVIDGKQKKVVGIQTTQQTAMKNITKHIPAAEQNEYVYDQIAKKVFCKLCAELISRIEYLNPEHPTCHHLTKQHQQNRKKHLESNLYQQNLTVAIRQKQHGKSLTTQITDANFEFRTDVVKSFMQAGVHLEVFASKNSPMRKLFDKYVSERAQNELRLTDASHLRKTHIPLVHAVEFVQIKEELSESDGWIGISFDETTKNRLWWAAVFRFVLNGVMQQRLVRLAAYKHGPDELIGHQLSCMVIDVLENFQILRKKVLHFSRDGVAVNGACIRYIYIYI